MHQNHHNLYYRFWSLAERLMKNIDNAGDTTVPSELFDFTWSQRMEAFRAQIVRSFDPHLDVAIQPELDKKEEIQSSEDHLS